MEPDSYNISAALYPSLMHSIHAGKVGRMTSDESAVEIR